MKKRLALFLAILMMAIPLSSCEIEEYEEEDKLREGEGSEDIGVLMTEETGNGYEKPWQNGFWGMGTTSVEIVSETETVEHIHIGCDCVVGGTVVTDIFSETESLPPETEFVSEDTTADPYETVCEETTADPEENRFEFSYDLDGRTKYRRGETISVTATVTNVSGDNYYYVGSSSEFMAYVNIFYVGDKHTEYALEHAPLGLDDDYMGQIIEPGESRSREFSFSIPANAPLGYYAIRLSYGDESLDEYYSIQIFEADYEFETDVYENRTGSCVAGYDGVKIKPLSGFVCESYTSQGDDGTGQGYEADGEGSWGIIYNLRAWGDDSFLPSVWTLYGESLDMDFGNYEFNGISIIEEGGSYDDIKHLSSVEELAELPFGEYYVILCLSRYEEAADGSWSRHVVFEDVFKLTVDVMECCEG